MNIGAVQADLKNELKPIYGASEALAIAEMVVEFYTGKTRVQQKLDSKCEVEPTHLAAIASAKALLKTHKPVQYVLGEAWFLGMPFYVNESVLIPRPETEELVMLAVENLRTNVSIIDIGTGSGCIPISLAKRMQDAAITSVDISVAAIEVAERNATKHHAQIQFKQLDFLNEGNWSQLPVFNAIVSNPPYIPEGEKEKIDRNVTLWEPDIALFVPNNNALLFYKKIALFGKSRLNQHGKIFVEVHQDYALATLEMFEENGYRAMLKKDINGNDRMIIAEKT